jgi:hypothetical protein
MQRILRSPARVLLIAVGAVGLALSTGAWGNHRLHSGSTAAIRGRVATSASKTVTTYKTLATFWWNDGSCHGYPDVIQFYEVFRDEYGNLIEYRDAGVTNGTDTCAQSHPATFYNHPNYTDCGGCDIEQSGAVQGNPAGTVTEHPQ